MVPDFLDQPAVAVGIFERDERAVVAPYRIQPRRLPLWPEMERLAGVHAALDIPTTAAFVAGRLWVVNARFGTPVTPTTDYWITKLPGRP